MLISCGADMGMHFANTTKFDVRKANPSGGHDRRADRMKSNANSESRPRALPSAFKAMAWPHQYFVDWVFFDTCDPFIG
jgi:hypothetical protein